MNTLLLAFEPNHLPAGTTERIAALAPDMQIIVSNNPHEIEGLLDQIEIIAGNFPTEILPRVPRLRWLQQWGAGADWLLRHPEIAARDFVLTTVSGVHAIPISEQILGYLLMFGRGMHQAVRAQQRGEWWRAERPDVFELANKTMLLVGVGAIGARTATLAQAFGMRVEGIRRDPAIPVEGVDAMYGPQHILERLPEADFVVLTIPLSRSTRALFGEAELHAMKRSAYLINIGRGGTIQEEVLIRALQEGWLAGAGLDVFAHEPLPPDSPLWGMEQVIITGHYAGVTPEYDHRGLDIFLDNLQRYRAGQPLHNVVDKHEGY